MTGPILLETLAQQAQMLGQPFAATLEGTREVMRGRHATLGLPMGAGAPSASQLPPKTADARRRDGAMPGLAVQVLDGEVLAGFEIMADRPPGLVVHQLLAGAARVVIGGTALLLEARVPMVGFSATGAVMPVRWQMARGQGLRSVRLLLSWDWLTARGIEAGSVLQGADHLHRNWHATPDEITRAEALMQAALSGQTLQAEALALAQIVALQARMQAGGGEADMGLGRKDRACLERMEQFALRPGPIPDLAHIAREGGVSQSSMRRLFLRAHGVPAMTRIRALRLARAREGLASGASVAQAAELAGFASAESFATAFRREFGQRPSEVKAEARG